MKKSIILGLCCLLLSIGQSKAQDKKFVPEWNVGVGFGITMPSVDFEPSNAAKSKNGFMGGVAVRYLSEKNLGLIAELNYSQQGWESEFKDSPQYEHWHRLNYLEVPILTHIYFGNKVRFFVNLGPKVGILFSQKRYMNDDLITWSNSILSGNDEDAIENLLSAHYDENANRKFDYGIMTGAGLEFRSKVGSFNLEGRYYFGLGDIYSNSKSDPSTRSANRVMGVKLTYYVKLF